MKPAVDATSPWRYKHLTENLKGKQMAEDKRLETERINKASQARLASMASMSVRKQEVRSPHSPARMYCTAPVLGFGKAS